MTETRKLTDRLRDPYWGSVSNKKFRLEAADRIDELEARQHPSVCIFWAAVTVALAAALALALFNTPPRTDCGLPCIVSYDKGYEYGVRETTRMFKEASK